MLSNLKYDLPQEMTKPTYFCMCARPNIYTGYYKYPKAECFNQKFAVCNETITTVKSLKSCTAVPRKKRSVERHISNKQRLFQLSNMQFKEGAKLRRKVSL